MRTVLTLPEGGPVRIHTSEYRPRTAIVICVMSVRRGRFFIGWTARYVLCPLQIITHLPSPPYKLGKRSSQAFILPFSPRQNFDSGQYSSVFSNHETAALKLSILNCFLLLTPVSSMLTLRAICQRGWNGFTRQRPDP